VALLLGSLLALRDQMRQEVVLLRARDEPTLDDLVDHDLLAHGLFSFLRARAQSSRNTGSSPWSCAMRGISCSIHWRTSASVFDSWIFCWIAIKYLCVSSCVCPSA